MTALVSALFAGLVAIGVTLAIERWGGRLGGLLGTLPTTIVPSAAGLALVGQADADFTARMALAPVGMLLNVGFLYLWRLVPPRLPAIAPALRLCSMIVVSLGAWSVAAWTVVVGADRLRELGVDLLPLGWLTTLAIATAGVLANRGGIPAPAGRRRVGPIALAARGLIAALAIGGSVWMAGQGGSVAAGIAQVFPAIFLTTMVALWLAQGEAVQAGAVGPMMLGSTSVAVYAMLSTIFLPALGIGWGSATGWLLAAGCVTLPAWLWIRRHEAL